MLRSVLSSLSKPARPAANLAYSTSASDHGGPGDVNFYEMVELFFDRAGKCLSSDTPIFVVAKLIGVLRVFNLI